jgi:putative DNA primase/helicase
VRAVLGPLVSLAADLKVAIIGIMHFNKKLDVTNALLRVSDSLAYGATARHVYGVVADADNRRELLVVAKNNLSTNAAGKALAFSFGVRDVGTDPNSGETIAAPHIMWHSEYVDVTATEAMQAASEFKSPTAVDDAKQFLRALLSSNGGRLSQADIEEVAAAEKISDKTLRRAKKALGIRAEKDHSVKDGKWSWVLPDDED